MKLFCGGVGIFALASIMQASFGNVILQDFNTTTPGSVSTSGGAYIGGVLSQSGSVVNSVYSVIGIATTIGEVTSDGQLRFYQTSTPTSSATYLIGFGSSLTDGKTIASGSNPMNQNWTSATAIRMNITEYTGTVVLGITMGTTGGMKISSASNIAVDHLGAYDINFSSLTKTFYADAPVTMSDVDWVQFSLNINSLGGSVTVDSIELITVPEPASLLTAGIGAAGLLMRRRKA